MYNTSQTAQSLIKIVAKSHKNACIKILFVSNKFDLKIAYRWRSTAGHDLLKSSLLRRLLNYYRTQ